MILKRNYKFEAGSINLIHVPRAHLNSLTNKESLDFEITLSTIQRPGAIVTFGLLNDNVDNQNEYVATLKELPEIDRPIINEFRFPHQSNRSFLVKKHTDGLCLAIQTLLGPVSVKVLSYL